MAPHPRDAVDQPGCPSRSRASHPRPRLADGPLAEAAWAKQRLGRATQLAEIERRIVAQMVAVFGVEVSGRSERGHWRSRCRWRSSSCPTPAQALPNGFCGLPVQQACPHANACLTCPMFLTTAEFLPSHRDQRDQTVHLITAAEARGNTRVVEMNRQVLANLDRVITSLNEDCDDKATDAS
jgi:hypothetical protein